MSKSKTTGNIGFSPSVKEFVESSGGNHEIRKVLVANNGIGAVKAIRSIRKWAFETFGDETAIQFVVMATPEDMRANAEFVRLADEVVDVPGGSNNNNYANVNLICEVAERCEVDAVMPMWGHASENPNLPSSLLKCKRRITFVGPPAEPMQALGDKIGSTIIAQSAGVPTIAWNGDGLTVDYKATGIPDEMYDEANVQTAEQALASSVRIGFPVMIKASEGGGGKGIRSVHREEDVVTLFRQVQGEVPGSPIFVMKMASGARHLEVQLLADSYGEAIALSGRDCSVQRRHQKIIEEGPPVAADPAVFRRMEQSAVNLAKTVGYCSAGTVEFLYVDETQTYAFLELNPRLQVEHPVTENILGINLPACQLQVAMGLPLHRIRDIRRLYGRHPLGRDTIDFEFAERCAPPKHCIGVRITAENPDAGFQPTSGKFKELQFRPAVDVWGYFSVNSSGLIHEYADSQFGHVFASGPDRESARRAMIVSLKELDIRGDISTTTQYIINLLQTEDYVQNRIDTAWLDKRIARHAELQLENLSTDPDHTLVVACGAALMSFKHFDERQTRFRHLLSVGQVPGKDTLSQSVGIDLIYKNIKYKMLCILGGPSSVIVECGEGSEDITIRKQSDGGHLLAARGKSHVIYSQDLGEGSGTRIILDGFTCNFTPEYDPTRLTSSVAGKLARLLVPDGSHVQAGCPYVEIEVMKMYMPLKAAESGIVKFQMSEGASLTPGDLIAVMDLDDPDRVVKAEEFHGSLIATRTDKETSRSFPHVIARESLKTINKIFEGYYFKEDAAASALGAYLKGLNDPALPSYEMEEALSVVRGRIPGPLYSAISKLNGKFREKVFEADKLLGIGDRGTAGFHVPYQGLEYPADQILEKLHAYLETFEGSALTNATKLTESLWVVAETYLYPSCIRTLVRMLGLTESYLEVEQLFDSQSFQDVVQTLRLSHPGDWDKVSTLCMSHVNLPLKNFLMLKVIEVMMVSQVPAVKFRPKMPKGIPLRLEMNIRNLKVRLTELSKLREGVYSRLSFAANLCLMDQQTMSYEKRHDKLQDTIVEALTTGDEAGQGERVTCLTRFVESGVAIKDLFFESLAQDRDFVIAFMELYLRRVYQKTHNLQVIDYCNVCLFVCEFYVYVYLFPEVI
jgi:acetyl-CoA carboxylase/biotin carboxylase 1